MRVLSLDWDYFFHAPTNIRDLFPSYNPQDSLKNIERKWKACYEVHPEIRDIAVDENSVKMIIDYFKDRRFHRRWVAESHESLYLMLNNETGFDLVNVDFHHDFSISRDAYDKPYCSSWLFALDEESRLNSVEWCRREDSEMFNLFGEFPYESYLDFSRVVQQEYDAVFFCYSLHWSPPHLNDRAKDVVLSLLPDPV